MENVWWRTVTTSTTTTTSKDTERAWLATVWANEVCVSLSELYSRGGGALALLLLLRFEKTQPESRFQLCCFCASAAAAAAALTPPAARGSRSRPSRLKMANFPLIQFCFLDSSRLTCAFIL